MNEKPEWITAADATAILGQAMRLTNATRAICKRAHVGLVSARAELFVFDNQSKRNCDIPKEMWWSGGESALIQNWQTGDFETWLDNKHHLKAFGVTFLREDIEKMSPPQSLCQKDTRDLMRAGDKIFIGHGSSNEWLKLDKFLKERLQLKTVEFNSEPSAGVSTIARLNKMLSGSTFAFLVMTAEDVQLNGAYNPRINVVHEAGLFQGRLGFERAIVLLEEGCEEFSNINGLIQIRFPKGNIAANFEEIRRTLEREGLTQPR